MSDKRENGSFDSLRETRLMSANECERDMHSNAFHSYTVWHEAQTRGPSFVKKFILTTFSMSLCLTKMLWINHKSVHKSLKKCVKTADVEWNASERQSIETQNSWPNALKKVGNMDDSFYTSCPRSICNLPALNFLTILWTEFCIFRIILYSLSQSYPSVDLIHFWNNFIPDPCP